MTKEEILARVLQAMADMTGDERMEFLGSIDEVYCRECGEPHPRRNEYDQLCQCWNDE